MSVYPVVLLRSIESSRAVASIKRPISEHVLRTLRIKLNLCSIKTRSKVGFVTDVWQICLHTEARTKAPFASISSPFCWRVWRPYSACRAVLDTTHRAPLVFKMLVYHV